MLLSGKRSIGRLLTNSTIRNLVLRNQGMTLQEMFGVNSGKSPCIRKMDLCILRKLQINGGRMVKAMSARRNGGNPMVPLAKQRSGPISGVALTQTHPSRLVMLMFGMNGGVSIDGQGGSIKYTDKWAERSEGDGWSKWGDKWDEHFGRNGHGVKQGETWWEGKHGERWNWTWGEGHNGSGWVHKYGKSSSAEQWDTHEEQGTWYDRYPHYGFYHCFENSVQLRQVKKPSE